MNGTRNQQIVCAYALLFTVAGGVVAMDLGTSAQPTIRTAPAMVSVSAPTAPIALPAPAAEVVQQSLSMVLPSELPPVPSSDADGSQANNVAAAQLPEAPSELAETPKRVAAPGTFYVLTRVSVVRDSGVQALSPGTAVKLLRRKGDKLRVTDGRFDFDLAAAQLTQDVEVAEKLAREATGVRRLARK